jgi:hypothetical protein
MSTSVAFIYLVLKNFFPESGDPLLDGKSVLEKLGRFITIAVLLKF